MAPVEDKGLPNSSAASMDRMSPASMAGLIRGVTGESGFMRPVLVRREHPLSIYCAFFCLACLWIALRRQMRRRQSGGIASPEHSAMRVRGKRTHNLLLGYSQRCWSVSDPGHGSTTGMGECALQSWQQPGAGLHYTYSAFSRTEFMDDLGCTWVVIGIPACKASISS